MGRQRNNPQMNGKEDSPEKELNEIEARTPSDIEFKIMVIRMFKELSDNYRELSGNYSTIKKDIETINKIQEEMKNTLSEMKYALEGIKSRLDEAED